MRNNFKKGLSIFIVLGLVMTAFGLEATTASAAALTSLSDNMSRLKASTASNHTVQFVTPTGLTGGQTITITFSADFTGVSGIDDTDVDLATAATCSGFSDRIMGAAPSGATWGVGASGQVITFTSGTDTITAGHCVQIEIGTNATSGVTGTEQVTNGALDDDDTVAIGGTFGDTGTLSVDIITDDQVVITATVDPSITFAISDNTTEFGTLSASSAKYADDSAGNGSEVESHTLQAGTNATGGYIMYVLGATLASGGNSINAIGASNTASSAGTEQFGLRMNAAGGSGSVLAPYAAAGFAYNATNSTQDDIASASGATSTTTYSVRYLANIASNTEAGAYSTTLTYTATASF